MTSKIFFLGIFLISVSSYSRQLLIYSGTDSLLTHQFIEALCETADNWIIGEPGPNRIEELVTAAAGSSLLAPDQPDKVYRWWDKYYPYLYCPVRRNREIHFMRLIVEKDVREVANELGPHGRLSMNTDLRDRFDSLTLLEFIKRERDLRAKRYRYETLQFQKDKRWKNYTFYMMLITNYEVEWAVLREEKD